MSDIYKRSSISLSQFTFIEWNFVKTKQQVIFRKTLLDSLKKWKLIQTLNIYLFKIFLKSLWTIVFWSIEKNPFQAQTHHDWWIVESCREGTNINTSRDITKIPSIREISIQTCSPETRLSVWILSLCILNIN